MTKPPRSEASDPPPSPVIGSVSPEGDPIEPFLTDGDLWLNTWADDGNVYSGWGDGLGVALHPERTDCGIARFSGSFPNIAAEERCYSAPTAYPAVNDKPSSLLYFDKRLYGHFHSPLGDAWIGFLAYSDDYGKTWIRVGFYQEGELQPLNASPWTRDKNSKFRCAFLINTGRSYELNADGYVYALGIGREWSWFGGTYLMRVKKQDILKYAAWEYFTGATGEKADWSSSQSDAVPLENVRTIGQGSAMYHPGIKRYLFLTKNDLFDAPYPWGPWTLAGTWTDKQSPVQWQGGYQPGIISKDTGPDTFWFTIAGQNQAPMITYRLHLGKMKMKLRVTRAPDQWTTPGTFQIMENYPNPFNPSTRIAFVLPCPGHVHLNVFESSGKEITSLVNKDMRQGEHHLTWNAAGSPCGVYFARLRFRPEQGRDEMTKIIKMTIVK